MKIVKGSTSTADSYTDMLDLSILSGKTNPVTGQPLTHADLQGAKAFVKVNDYYLAAYNVDVSTDNLHDTMTRDATWGGQSTPLMVGNGYWLENKPWMIDQPGEWAFERSEGKIYLWMPSGMTLNQGHLTAGLSAAVRVHAVAAKLTAPTTFKLQNLTFADTRGDAVAINGGSGPIPTTPYVTVSNVVVNNAGRAGISVKNMTTNGNQGTTVGTGVIDSSTVNNSQAGGIELYYNSTDGFKVTSNTVRNAGIGYFAHAGIWMGHKSIATGNLVDNSTYLGIDVAKFNTVSGNTVTRSCMEFNDCGGIYMTGKVPGYDARGWNTNYYYSDVYSTVSGNFVSQAGATDAQCQERCDGVASPSGSQIKGIYLDDRTANATISQNYVERFDYGIMLHLARNNTVQGNMVFGNARNALWMQEDKITLDMCTDPAFPGVPTSHLQLPSCDANNYIAGNQILDNRLASDVADASTSAPGYQLVKRSTNYASVSDFATFSHNGYAGFQEQYLVLDQFGTAAPQLTTPDTWLQNVPADSWSINYGPYPPAGYYNNLPFSKSVACPVANATYCAGRGNMYEMKTSVFISSFPYTVPANGSAIIVPWYTP